MTTKTFTLATAIAVIGPLTVAVTNGSFAASGQFGTAALKAAAPTAATDVAYRTRGTPQYRDFAHTTRYPYYSYYNEDYWRDIRGVVPYGSRYGDDPLRGTYWDNVAPY